MDRMSDTFPAFDFYFFTGHGKIDADENDVMLLMRMVSFQHFENFDFVRFAFRVEPEMFGIGLVTPYLFCLCRVKIFRVGS